MLALLVVCSLSLTRLFSCLPVCRSYVILSASSFLLSFLPLLLPFAPFPSFLPRWPTFVATAANCTKSSSWACDRMDPRNTHLWWTRPARALDAPLLVDWTYLSINIPTSLPLHPRRPQQVSSIRGARKAQQKAQQKAQRKVRCCVALISLSLSLFVRVSGFIRDASFDSFLHALDAAQPQSIPGHAAASFLPLLPQPGVPTPTLLGDPSSPGRLFIRECYPKMWEIIAKQKREVDEGREPGRGVLITGNSGVSKVNPTARRKEQRWLLIWPSFAPIPHSALCSFFA